MSALTSLSFIILAMLIQSFLQTSPSVFAIFYHHNLSKTSKKKADDRSLSFILGVEIAVSIIFLITYFAITFLFPEKNFLNPIFLWIMSGIFFIETVFMLFFYFRLGKKFKKTTKLFVPRHIANKIVYLSEHTKKRTDAVILGILTVLIELIFTLPLMVISSIGILNLSPRFGFIFIIAYIIIATLPLFTIRTLFYRSHNLATIQRFRAKNKMLFRLIISISYLALAIITLILGVNQWQ